MAAIKGIGERVSYCSRKAMCMRHKQVIKVTGNKLLDFRELLRHCVAENGDVNGLDS